MASQGSIKRDDPVTYRTPSQPATVGQSICRPFCQWCLSMLLSVLCRVCTMSVLCRVHLSLGRFELLKSICPGPSQHRCSLFLSYVFLIFSQSSLFILILEFSSLSSLLLSISLYFSLSLSICLRRSELLQKVFCKAHLAVPGWV